MCLPVEIQAWLAPYLRPRTLGSIPALLACLTSAAVAQSSSNWLPDEGAAQLYAPAWMREELPAWVEPYVGKRGMPPPWSDTSGWIGWHELGFGRDRFQANRFIVYRPETAAFLYADYTPLAAVYRRGALPLYEQLLENDPVCRAVRDAATPLEKAMRLLHETMPALVRHPKAPPCRPGTPPDRDLDDVMLLRSGRAWCNEQARIYVRFCQILGIPARLVFLHGLESRAHVVAEIFVVGRWSMVDVTWQITFPDANGRLMSAADVHTTLGRKMAGDTYAARWRELYDGPDSALGEADPAATRRYLAKELAEPASLLWVFGILNYPLPD